ncbi:hypothetical protein J4Q44_G00376530 [Coregonus suidteri]|uniref:Uncharacterized protein n=1 Tax=Coregonus suidteri TaxID=861788 RepID=A0AAN8KJJ7_9TELE
MEIGLPVASPKASVTLESLEEMREIRLLQYEAYHLSLAADQEKEIKLCRFEEWESRQRKSIEERRQRVASHPGQHEGVPFKIKHPDGRERIRRFRLSESIQAAAGFATLKNTINGSLEENDSRESTKLSVFWLSVEDVQNPGIFKGMMQNVNPFKSTTQVPVLMMMLTKAGTVFSQSETQSFHSDSTSNSDSLKIFSPTEKQTVWYTDKDATSSVKSEPPPPQENKKRTGL